MADYTPYQKKAIERYYDRREEIMLARLSEIVTELALAESDRRKDQLWKRAGQAMKSLNVPERLYDHIMSTRNPEVLARNLRDWLQKPAGHRAKPSNR